RHVSLHPVNPELLQSTNRLADSPCKSPVMRNKLYKQAVIMSCDHRAGISHASIQADSVACTGTVQVNLSVIRKKMVGRVFRGDAHLNSVSNALHLILRINMNIRTVKRISLRNKNLAYYDINTRNHLCHRVLHLNPRIHLNEIRMLLLVYQKLHSARIGVAYPSRQPLSAVKNLFSNLLRYGPCRSELDNLLVIFLYRTISVI